MTNILDNPSGLEKKLISTFKDHIAPAFTGKGSVTLKGVDVLKVELKRYNSEIRKAVFHYLKNGKHLDKAVILKHGLKSEENVYEKRIYDFYKSTSLDCFVRLYDYWSDEDIHVLDYFGEKSLERFNSYSFEERMKNYNSRIQEIQQQDKENITPVEKDKQIEVLKEQKYSEIETLVRAIAELHYKGTRELHRKIIEGKDKFVLKDRDGVWQVDAPTNEEYKKKFISSLKEISEKNPNKKYKKKLGKPLDKLKKYLWSKKRRADFLFEALTGQKTDDEPRLPPFLLHADLHGGNVRSNGSEIKFIDLKNVKLGSCTLDLSILHAPYILDPNGGRSELVNPRILNFYKLYLNTLSSLYEQDKMNKEKFLLFDPFKLGRPSEFDLYTQSKICDMYWSIRVARAICNYIDKFPDYISDLRHHIGNITTSIKYIEELKYSYRQPGSHAMRNIGEYVKKIIH